jgi:hypothetical protein
VRVSSSDPRGATGSGAGVLPAAGRGGQHRAPDAESPALASSPVGRLALAIGAVLAVLVPLTTAIDIAYPGRWLPAMAFLLFLPGLPLVALIRLPDRLAAVTLTVAVSLAVQVVTGMLLLGLGLFGAVAVQVVVAAVSLAATYLCWRRAEKDSVELPLAAQFGRWLSQAGTGLRNGLVPALGLILAFALWVIGVNAADPATMNGYGLISLLNPWLLAAIAVLVVVAVIELSRGSLRGFWLGAVAVGFVVLLQGMSSAIEPVAGFPVGWLHMGFADYFTTYGTSLNGYDARFSWPGFFAMLSVLSTSTGFTDGAELLRWAPAFGDSLMLLPLMLLARSLSPSKRAMWLAPLLYAVGNWFQQDYLSPQQLAWFLGLTVIAVLVWSARPAQVSIRPSGAGFRLPGYLWRPALPAERIDRLDGRGYVRLLAALVVLMAAVVMSHQLTPVVLVMALLVLTFAKRTRFPGLWLVLAVLAALWISFGASDYWAGHLSQIFGGVGNLGGNLASGVTERVSGTPEHLQMQTLRIAFSALLMGLALLGMFMIRRSGSLLVLAGLSFAPFALIAMQSYGGEVLLRCFVFALPALAIAGAQVLAVLVAPGMLNRVIPIGSALAVVVLMVLSLLQVAARGANAPFERVTVNQLAAVDVIDQVAPQGARVALFDSFAPLGKLEPGRLRGLLVTADVCGSDPVGTSCVIGLQPDVLWVSSSTDAYGHLVEGRDPNFGEQVAAELVARGTYSVLFQADDVTVLIHNTPGATR